MPSAVMHFYSGQPMHFYSGVDSRMIVLPAFLQPTDRRCRKPWRILAEKSRQRFGEVAGRDALEVQDRQQRLDRFRAPHVGRQWPAPLKRGQPES